MPGRDTDRGDRIQVPRSPNFRNFMILATVFKRTTSNLKFGVRNRHRSRWQITVYNDPHLYICNT